MAIPVLYNPGTDGSLAIIDSDGNVYNLPQGIQVRSIPFARQSETLKRAFGHGARDVADGTYLPRSLELYHVHAAETDAAYLTKWDELAEKLLVLEDFWLRAGTRQIQIKRVTEFNETFGDGFRLRLGEYAAMLLAEDPRWYRTTTSVHNIVTGGASPYQFSVYVGGTAELHPVITIENLADNADFKVEHMGDEASRWSRLQDAGALSGTTIEIDCVNGTVTRDGVTSVIQYMTGLFLRLLPNRDNVLRYTGASANIRLTHRWAYL